jgi:putative peptidoglycan lipid II flippase
LSAIIYVIVQLGARPIVEWLSGHHEPLVTATLQLLVVLLPTVILYPAAMVASAILQAQNRFSLAAIGPIVVNLFLGGAAAAAIGLGLSSRHGSIAASMAFVAGTLIMLVLYWIPLRPGMLPSRRKLISTTVHENVGLWRTFRLYLFMLLSSQLLYGAERFFAAHTTVGAITALGYAFRLSQFPVWVFVSALGSVLLSGLSRNAALQETKEMQSSVNRSIRVVMLVTVPLSAMLVLFREPITSLLFERGVFDEHSVRLTAGILSGYAMNIVFQSLIAVVLRYFLAVDSLKRPALIGAGASLISISIDIMLLPSFGVNGLGYGALVGSAFNAAALLALVHRRLNLRPALVPSIRIISANIFPMIVTRFAVANVQPMISDLGKVGQMCLLVGAAVLYFVVYGCNLYLIKRLQSNSKGSKI